MKAQYLQIAISLVALTTLIVHLVWPDLAIDGITVTLILLAVLPWLAPLFKSVELPGGWKIEFKDLEKATDKADKAGLLADKSQTSTKPEYSFLLVADEDPNLALAGLRIELEKRLMQLAESHNLLGQLGGRGGVGPLLRVLDHSGVLSSNEAATLQELTRLLNSAVHGADVDKSAVDWAIEIGPRLLQGLDNKRMDSNG